MLRRALVLRRLAARRHHPVPALAPGQPQPGQRGGPGPAARLDGTRPPVGEARQDAGRLLVRAQRRPARGLDGAAGTEVVDEPFGALGRLVVEELPVDHHHGRVVAGRVALDVLQRDLAVLGRPAVGDAQVVLELVEDGVAAQHRAQGVGAHPHLVVAPGRAPVHGVEGRDRRDLRRGEPEPLGAEADAGAGDVPVLGLHEVQQRQQRAAAVGVAGDHLVGVRVQPGADIGGIVGGGERGHPHLHGCVTHRSTPPITGSMDATATMTSATMPPSHIAAMAWRLVKDGSRKWTR